MKTRHVLGLTGIAIGVTFLLAACGGTPTATPTATTAPTPTTAPAPADTSEAPTRVAPTPTRVPATAAPTATPVPNARELAEAHFKGKTIRVFVGYSPGGGQDTNARVTSKYLGKYIPGNPRIVVQNLTGADGLIAAQRVMSSPPDGTNIVLANLVLHQQQATSKQPHPGFDLSKAVHLGNVQVTSPGSSALLCTRSDVAKTFDEAIAKADQLGRPLRAGVFRAGSWGVILPKYLNMPFQPVPGYTGTATILQAIDQKELEILIDACTFEQMFRARPEWLVPNSVIHPIANRDGNDLTAAKEGMYDKTGWPFPTPLLEDVAKLDEQQKQVLKVSRTFGGPQTHPWVVHGETPAFAVSALKSALEGVTKDPDFNADFAKIGRTAGYTPGEVYDDYFKEIGSYEGFLFEVMKDFAGLTN